jgi:hypothetical protein
MTIDPKPFLPYPKNTYWFWEIVNVLVPTIGILFFNWNIYSILYLFWMEILVSGAIGVLQIISAGGVKGGLLIHLYIKVGNLSFFTILYLGLFLILFSFTFVELDTSSIFSSGGGIAVGLIFMIVNYLAAYIRGEILSENTKPEYRLKLFLRSSSLLYHWLHWCYLWWFLWQKSLRHNILKR